MAERPNPGGVERLRELAEKASTAGQWEAVSAGEPPHVIEGQAAWDVLGPYTLRDDQGAGWMPEHIAALIVAAVNALPALLDVAEAATEAVAWNDSPKINRPLSEAHAIERRVREALARLDALAPQTEEEK